MAIENIHSEMYSVLLESYIKDSEEENLLFRAIETVPCVERKPNWALHNISGPESFAENLIAFACVKAQVNARSNLFKRVNIERRRLTLRFRVHALQLTYETKQGQSKGIHGGCSRYIERDFVCDILPCALIGMNGNLMNQYIEFVADRLLNALGYGKLLDVQNPFDWMN